MNPLKFKQITQTNIYKQWKANFPNAETTPGYIISLAEDEIKKNILIAEQQFLAKYQDILEAESFKKWRLENPKAMEVPEFIVSLARQEIPTVNQDEKPKGTNKTLLIGGAIAAAALVIFLIKK